MTKETRHFIELSDIISFQFRCKKCGATVSRPISGTRNVPGAICGNCDIDWSFDPSETRSIEELASKIRYVKKIIGEKNFTLRIEIADPSEEKS